MPFFCKNDLLQFKNLKIISLLGKTNLRNIRKAFCLIKPMDIYYRETQKIQMSERKKCTKLQCRAMGTLLHCYRKCSLLLQCSVNSLALSIKDMHIWWPRFPLLGTYPIEICSCEHQKNSNSIHDSPKLKTGQTTHQQYSG